MTPGAEWVKWVPATILKLFIQLCFSLKTASCGWRMLPHSTSTKRHRVHNTSYRSTHCLAISFLYLKGTNLFPVVYFPSLGGLKKKKIAMISTCLFRVSQQFVFSQQSVVQCVKGVVLSWGNCVASKILSNVWRHFWLSLEAGGMLLVWERPGMLVSKQPMIQLPATVIQSQMSTAVRLRNRPCWRITWHF